MTLTTAPPEPASTPAAAPPRRERRGVIVVAAVAVVALVAGALLWTRRGAEEASLDDATRRYQEAPTLTTSVAQLLTPAPGVYRYTGSGTEQLSLLQTQQPWGPQLPATITTTGPGCWTFRIDYSTNHWQETSYCVKEGVLLETGGKTWQRFDFVAMKAEDTVEFTCTPPNEIIRSSASPGDSWSQSCVGHSPARSTTVTSSGPTTFLGPEDLSVGGTSTAALHYRSSRTLTGDQQGTETTDYWYSTATGQIVRLHREDRVDSPSPIGPVTYTESGDYQLADPHPLGA